MVRAAAKFTSGLAIWSRRLGLFSLAVASIGVYLGRTSSIPLVQAIAVVGSALVLASLSIVFAVAAFVTIWRTGMGGLRSAYLGLFSSLCLMVYPAFLSFTALTLPVLNDITSDFVDPPAFQSSNLQVDTRFSNARPKYNAAFANSQREAYPDIQPIVLELGLEESWALVQEAIKPLNWRIVEITPPKPKATEARLEAIEYSIVMKVPDDISIRLRALGPETRIDLRFASRFGRHDFGSNAARARRLIDNITTLAKDR